jgi:hypothetical protein
MSTIYLRNSVRNLVLLIGLGLAGGARADHVDWGPYLETPGAKPMAVKSTPSVAATPKPAAKQRTVAAKPKAKAKPAAARKPRR